MVKFEMKKTGDLAKALLKLKQDLSNKSVKVGVMGKADRSRGGKAAGPGENTRPIGNVELAVIHEYGAPKANIPARSFLWSTMKVNRKAYADLIASLQKGIINKKLTVSQALNLLGMRVANDAKNRIADGSIKQDLAESTLAHRMRKAASAIKKKHKQGIEGPANVRALLDSGQLKNSITWVVDE